MQKKHLWIALAVLLVLALGGYYFASPWITLAHFKADAQARNTNRMERYVDFPAVRASLKTQLQARVAAKIGADASNPLAAIGMALANALIDPVVTVVASPQGIVAMMNGENPMPGLDKLGIAIPDPVPRMQPQSWRLPPADAQRGWVQVQAKTHPQTQVQTQPPAPSTAPDAAQRKPWKLSYRGLDYAMVHTVPATPDAPYLIMQRRGLFEWKVVDVQLGNFWPMP